MAWPMNSKPTADLHLRSSGSTAGSILATIPKGAAISVTGQAVNGWYPVTYGTKTGWVSGAYLGAMTAPPVTTPTPTTPTPIPHTQSGSNPFYSSGSTYGSSQNWYSTPLVKDSMSAQNPQGEYEKFVTDAGFGGVNRLGNAARSLYDRAQAGYAGASLNNPDLSFRSYLTDMLGPAFLKNQIAAMTPSQLGEQYQAYSPRVRWVTR